VLHLIRFLPLALFGTSGSWTFLFHRSSRVRLQLALSLKISKAYCSARYRRIKVSTLSGSSSRLDVFSRSRTSSAQTRIIQKIRTLLPFTSTRLLSTDGINSRSTASSRWCSPAPEGNVFSPHMLIPPDSLEACNHVLWIQHRILDVDWMPFVSFVRSIAATGGAFVFFGLSSGEAASFLLLIA